LQEVTASQCKSIMASKKTKRRQKYAKSTIPLYTPSDRTRKKNGTKLVPEIALTKKTRRAESARTEPKERISVL